MSNFKKNFILLFALILLTPTFGVFSVFVDVSVFRQQDIYSTEVFAAERRYIIPLGKSVGVDIEMDGVKIIEISEILDKNNQVHSPTGDAGLQTGDNIVRISGIEVQSVEDVTRIMNEENVAEDATAAEPIEVEIRRGDENLELTVEPIWDDANEEFRIAARVKDSTSGIGTLTFYDPESGGFGALGHGITGEGGAPLQISGGNILSSTVVSVTPSERGQIGELRGIFLEQTEVLGEVKVNNEQGLYGKLDSEMLDLSDVSEMPIAKRNEVKAGRAYILSNIDSVRVEKFEIEIQRILRRTSDNTKEMIIRVTDKDLLARSGGIVQGMSGSPIIQNGKIAGAVTHVFVNDPSRGYGIFIESMLDNSTI